MTPNAQSLEGLIERVKAATAQDRELDCQIAYALNYEVEGMAASFRSYCDVHDLKWGEIARHANSPQSILSHNLPRFTASIDAALALVERVLPGCYWTIEADACWIRVLTDDDVAEFQGNKSGMGGRWTPLAILLALLQALKEHSNDHES
jgi:hypothetical protein